MGVLVRIEDIGDAELAHCEHQAIGAVVALELIGGSVDRFPRLIKVERLAHEQAWKPQVRLLLADLVGLTARKPRDAQRIVQAKALIDLRICPDLRARPETRAHIKGRIRGFPADAGRQAVGSAVGRIEPRCLLFHVRHLSVNGKPIARFFLRCTWGGGALRRAVGNRLHCEEGYQAGSRDAAVAIRVPTASIEDGDGHHASP